MPSRQKTLEAARKTLTGEKNQWCQGAKTNDSCRTWPKSLVARVKPQSRACFLGALKRDRLFHLANDENDEPSTCAANIPEDNAVVVFVKLVFKKTRRVQGLYCDCER